MSQYKAVIKPVGQNRTDFYAFIVRVEKDGYESVIHGYKGRYFKSYIAADKSTAAYILKM